MAKQVAKRKKPAPKEIGVVQTGVYGVDRLREIIKLIATEELHVVITVPRSAANLVPLLSPHALKYIEFECFVDSRFEKQGTFVVEVGKRKYAWKTQ